MSLPVALLFFVESAVYLGDFRDPVLALTVL